MTYIYYYDKRNVDRLYIANDKPTRTTLAIFRRGDVKIFRITSVGTKQQLLSTAIDTMVWVTIPYFPKFME